MTHSLMNFPRIEPSRRTSNLWLLGAAAAMALTGCELGAADDVSSNNAAPTFEQFLGQTYLEPWEGGVYIVNGDTAIGNEKKLREFHTQVFGTAGALIVHRVGNADAAWNITQKKNLTYCVSEKFGANKALIVQAMNEATASWEAAADIDFKHDTSQDATCTAANPNVVFDVGQVENQPYLARAFFPGERRAARNVLVDTSSFGNLGAITLAGILRHELGHVLGFRHEHTRPEAGTCFEDNSWRALTAYDSASTMHYPQCNGTGADLSLTATDVAGAQALYGAPNATPTPTPDPTPTPGEGKARTAEVSGSVARGAAINYDPVTVLPGSRLVAQLAGTGDADLYVRFDQRATLVQFDCRPYLISSNESCELDVPAGASQVFVSVDGYTASTYTLKIDWVEP